MWGKKPEPEMVQNAQCPSCDCTHSVGVFQAKQRGGNGSRVVSRESGEVVRCCACGTMYTILVSGEVLAVKRRETSRPPVANGAPRRGGFALDDDLEDLTR